MTTEVRSARSLKGTLRDARARLRELALATRPVHPETRAALERRWSELPPGARVPAQTLGQHAVGCEGTHGVFPKCNLACTPCYHSRDANRVAISGEHTRSEVGEQMAFFRRIRGPRAHAQLIGGEVTLLPADDHAATLKLMLDAGREPMSMTHGDFDADYLTEVALGPDGRKRFDRLSFAGHFDMLMFGRRGIERPADEASLNPHRKAFTAMFAELKRQHGVRYFLAHNMTVTPRNVDQIADVLAECHDYGFGMFSFQPAAFVGDDRRWHDGYREIDADIVWAEIERGAGTRLPYGVFQNGDVRCNRTAYGFYVGDRWYPVLDDESPRDLAVRDAFFRYCGGINFSGTPIPLLAVKLARVVARHPQVATIFLGWLGRTLHGVGLRKLLSQRIRPVSFVMHSFMDAGDVAPAWAAMQRGEALTDPVLKATQERLQACSYAMAHPETGELVPACVQHGVLDPGENAALRVLLPLAPVTDRRIRHAPATSVTAGSVRAGGPGGAGA